MSEPVRSYTSESVEITYSVRRCIHAAECVRGLPAVFDSARRPWIAPGEAAADAIVEVVGRCPTGALHAHRRDGGPAEQPLARSVVLLTPDGPLYVRGRLTLLRGDGALLAEDTRVALCRCGQSANKPFCDNSHRAAAFADPGAVAAGGEPEGEGGLTITATPNGPLVLRGPFSVRSADGAEYFGRQAALCRCGGSGSKPFCDGSHKANGFHDEEARDGE